MMLEDSKQHFEEVLKTLNKALSYLSDNDREFLSDPDYLKKLNDFQERFKLWKPSIYIYVEGGLVQSASADCDMHFNLFDDDNEKQRMDLDLKPGEDTYMGKSETWNWMIDSGHRDGTLKTIY